MFWFNLQTKINPARMWTLENFELGPQIGSGQFSKVFLAREKSTGFICAIKMIPKDRILQSGSEDQVVREIRIMSSVMFCLLLLLFHFKMM